MTGNPSGITNPISMTTTASTARSGFPKPGRAACGEAAQDRRSKAATRSQEAGAAGCECGGAPPRWQCGQGPSKRVSRYHAPEGAHSPPTALP